MEPGSTAGPRSWEKSKFCWAWLWHCHFLIPNTWKRQCLLQAKKYAVNVIKGTVWKDLATELSSPRTYIKCSQCYWMICLVPVNHPPSYQGFLVLVIWLVSACCSFYSPQDTYQILTFKRQPIIFSTVTVPCTRLFSLPLSCSRHPRHCSFPTKPFRAQALSSALHAQS